jgi:hypothetical protein
MKLPKSWNDVTVAQYIEAKKSVNIDSNFESQLELLGVLADVPTEDLEELELDEFSALLAKISFVQSEPNKRPAQTILEYQLKPLNKIKVEEFLDLEYYVTKDYIEHLPIICAILYKQTRVDEWKHLSYEPHEYDLEERTKDFLNLSINSVYGVITSYLQWRENFLNTYSNLFDEPITEEDLQEVEPEDRKELEAEMKMSKWAWEKTIYILANEDITNMEKVLGMNVIFAFNMLSMKKDTES